MYSTLQPTFIHNFNHRGVSLETQPWAFVLTCNCGLTSTILHLKIPFWNHTGWPKHACCVCKHYATYVQTLSGWTATVFSLFAALMTRTECWTENNTVLWCSCSSASSVDPVLLHALCQLRSFCWVREYHIDPAAAPSSVGHFLAPWTHPHRSSGHCHPLRQCSSHWKDVHWGGTCLDPRQMLYNCNSRMTEWASQ